jgi:hypothetical protein
MNDSNDLNNIVTIAFYLKVLYNLTELRPYGECTHSKPPYRLHLAEPPTATKDAFIQLLHDAARCLCERQLSRLAIESFSMNFKSVPQLARSQASVALPECVGLHPIKILPPHLAAEPHVHSAPRRGAPSVKTMNKSSQVARFGLYKGSHPGPE